MISRALGNAILEDLDVLLGIWQRHVETGTFYFIEYSNYRCGLVVWNYCFRMNFAGSCNNNFTYLTVLVKLYLFFI